MTTLVAWIYPAVVYAGFVFSIDSAAIWTYSVDATFAFVASTDFAFQNCLRKRPFLDERHQLVALVCGGSPGG